jgi:hypothetical protein
MLSCTPGHVNERADSTESTSEGVAAVQGSPPQALSHVPSPQALGETLNSNIRVGLSEEALLRSMKPES